MGYEITAEQTGGLRRTNGGRELQMVVLQDKTRQWWSANSTPAPLA